MWFLAWPPTIFQKWQLPVKQLQASSFLITCTDCEVYFSLQIVEKTTKFPSAGGCSGIRPTWGFHPGVWGSITSTTSTTTCLSFIHFNFSVFSFFFFVMFFFFIFLTRSRFPLHVSFSLMPTFYFSFIPYIHILILVCSLLFPCVPNFFLIFWIHFFSQCFFFLTFLLTPILFTLFTSPVHLPLCTFTSFAFTPSPYFFLVLYLNPFTCHVQACLPSFHVIHLPLPFFYCS